MTDKDKDRIECAIRHIKSSVDVDTWAMDIAIDAMKAQLSQEGTTKGTTFDLISRQDAIDMFQRLADDEWNQRTATIWANAYLEAVEMIQELPSVQPEHISDPDRIYTELSKIYNMSGLPDEVYSIIGDLMLELPEPYQGGEKDEQSHEIQCNHPGT